MAESKLKDENYYQIQGWMINRLGIKGITLSVYAIIYGFSQDGESEFTGSLQYLCDFTGGTSKPTIIKALKELVEKGYIIRREEYTNGVQFNRYKANLPLLKNFNGGSKEILTGTVKNLNEGSKETLPNNNINNKNIINSDIGNEEQKRKRFAPPTLEEVKAYCAERKNSVDAERFIDYYTSNGWLVGKNKMKDWKAAVRTWERNGFSDKAPKNASGANGSFDTDDFFNAALKKSCSPRAALERDVINRSAEKAQNPPKTAADDAELQERVKRLKEMFF